MALLVSTAVFWLWHFTRPRAFVTKPCHLAPAASTYHVHVVRSSNLPRLQCLGNSLVTINPPAKDFISKQIRRSITQDPESHELSLL